MSLLCLEICNSLLEASPSRWDECHHLCYLPFPTFSPGSVFILASNHELSARSILAEWSGWAIWWCQSRWVPSIDAQIGSLLCLDSRGRRRLEALWHPTQLSCQQTLGWAIRHGHILQTHVLTLAMSLPPSGFGQTMTSWPSSRWL